ncbi:MAG: alpha amylase N-terminal ig-like domain-containing protein, partial [Lachnospiraceae bacterium]
MKSLQIAAIRHMPWLEDRHTLSDGRVCIRLTTAVNEFDAVTLRHADHYAEGEPFARATDTPMERMWRDENHEVWQAVFRPHDPRIVYAFILRAGDVTLLHDADGTRAVPEKPEWVNGFHYAHAYPAKEKPQWARGCVG